MGKMIKIESKGSFRKTERFLSRMAKPDRLILFDKFAKEGLAALYAATPVDTGLTSVSWTYEVTKNRKGPLIIWRNTNTETGVPVAILLQYGHAARDGTWVDGKDYINPAIQPLFDRISEEVWKQVKNG